MKKGKNIELDNETLDRIVAMAREEKKPFEAIRNEFGLNEKEVTDIMKKKFSTDDYEMWKKRVAAKKPKPKSLTDDDYDDLDSKYYIKNKF
jgi:uncharacterized protein (TIGR03643 family)